MAKSASVDAAKKAAASAKKAGINVPDAIVPQHDPASDEENLVGSALGPEAQQAVDGVTDEIRSHCPALTYKQRLYGALSCIGIGFLMSVGATLALLGGKDHLSDYAVLYTLGNVCSICGSGFVVGPCRQAKLMFKPVRRLRMIYLSTMIATGLVAIYYADILLIFSLLIIQYCASYGTEHLSYHLVGHASLKRARRAVLMQVPPWSGAQHTAPVSNWPVVCVARALSLSLSLLIFQFSICF